MLGTASSQIAEHCFIRCSEEHTKHMIRYCRIEVACRALGNFVLKVAEEQTRNHTRPNHVLRQLVLDEDQHVAVTSAYNTKYDGYTITETTSRAL